MNLDAMLPNRQYLFYANAAPRAPVSHKAGVKESTLAENFKQTEAGPAYGDETDRNNADPCHQ